MYKSAKKRAKYLSEVLVTSTAKFLFHWGEALLEVLVTHTPFRGCV